MNFMKKTISGLALAGLLVLGSCTDLEEQVFDEVITSELASGPGSENTIIAPVYGSLRETANFTGAFALNMHSSDELQGPTRGTDWDDNGVWRVLHTHDWDPFNLRVVDAWNTMNQGVARAIVANNELENLGASAQLRAEARFLRAFFLYMVGDLFGQVPYRELGDTNYTVAPQVLDRSELTPILIEELNAIRGDLPAKPAAQYGRVSQAACDMLLAKIHMNAGVYINGDGTQGNWAEAEAALDRIIGTDGDPSIGLNYGIATDYFDMFATDNDSNYGPNDEGILVAIFDRDVPTGTQMGPFWNMTLHYNQGFGNDGFSPWNGFTTIAETYNRFDQENDVRFRDSSIAPTQGIALGLLQGQQRDRNGNELSDRNGNPLFFTVDAPLITSGPTLETAGVRVIKYQPDAVTTDQGRAENDFLIFRYSDAVLMRAEARLRSGNTAGALSDINAVRTARGLNALSSVNLDEILDERSRELYWEGHRRQDLIRFGKFTEAWTNKDQTSADKIIFPIPQTAIDVNPNLTQNPGY